MIVVKIGDEERRYEHADAHWVTQQITRRRADGLTPCIRVTIKTGSLNMVLSTPSCASTAGGGRLPTLQETAIFDLWQQGGLNDPAFTPGSIVAFLQHLRRSF